MGGGDLNLKKSWDPRRRDNQEKKWKQEETDKNEQRRMKELLDERRGEKALEEMRRQGEDAGVIEKQKDRLDWMYKGLGGHTNPDDYLLGKEVDKAIVVAQSTQKETTGAQGGVALAGAVFGSSANIALDTKDMARKMREDPLFAIKKRELNSRKELVSNPIRMKQLQQMLQTQVGKDKKKSKKAKKTKEKRSKKHKKSRNSRSESSSQEDTAANLSKRRPQRQRASPDKRRKHHRGRDERRRKGSPDSSSESEEDDARSRQDKQRTIASLDRAKMKELLEREMMQKHRIHREATDSSSSESDSDETERNQKRRENKSGNRSRSRHLDGEQKQRFKSHEDGSDSRKRRKERSVSPQWVKRKGGVDDDEKTKMRYGLQRGARSQQRSQTPSPERPARDHHQPENRDRHSERYRDRSPHTDANKHSDRYPEKSHNRHRDKKSTSPQPPKEKHAYRHSDGKSEKHGRRERSRSQSPVRHRGRSTDKHMKPQSKSPQRQNGSPKTVTTKRKLTAEEMERKRAEMMDNAKWRDDQRQERVKIYDREEQAEVEMEKKKAKNAEFVQPLKLPDNSSVEDRIHRNIYSIQRTKAALDKNFAKR